MDGIPGKAGWKTGWDEEMLQIGLQALRTIRPDYETRSRIALQMAEYALSVGNQETAEFCWLEAFRSDPSLVNFLRLMKESRDFEPDREKVREIYLKCWRTCSPGSIADYDSRGKNTWCPIPITPWNFSMEISMSF